MAALLVLAGCSTGLDPGSGTGTVNFYMSDQPGAIEEFDHLNVTVDEVTFVRADGNQTTKDANATVDLTRLRGSNASLIEEYDVESGDYTKVFLSVEAVDGTLTNGSSADVKLPSEKLQLNQNFTVGDGEEVDFVYDVMVTKAGGSAMYVLRPVASESGTDVEIDEVEMDTDRRVPANGTDASAEQGSLNFYVSDEKNAINDFEHLNATITKVGFQRSGESGNWTEYDVDNRTVDLTELKGDNATLLETFDIESGNYTKVFVHVSAVNGTLTDGSSADVKLPSEKLQLNENVRVEENATVDFVYDITVVKRGNSGSYNIKPVASESGTDIPIDDVDERADDDDDDEADDADLSAEFVGNVSAGENATVRVTSGGGPVENATVEYNDTEYTTDADGEATFAVAENASEVEVSVTFDGSEAEAEADVAAENGGAADSENGTAVYAFQPVAA